MFHKKSITQKFSREYKKHIHFIQTKEYIKRLRLKNIFTWEAAQLTELTCNVEIEMLTFSF